MLTQWALLAWILDGKPDNFVFPFANGSVVIQVKNGEPEITTVFEKEP